MDILIHTQYFCKWSKFQHKQCLNFLKSKDTKNSLWIKQKISILWLLEYLNSLNKYQIKWNTKVYFFKEFQKECLN